MPFDVRHQKHTEVDVLTLFGDLDPRGARKLQETLLPLTGEPRILLVDCRRLESVSGDGLRILVTAGRHLQAVGGGFALCALRPEVQKIFDVAQMRDAVVVHKDRREAVVALRRQVRAERVARLAGTLLRQTHDGQQRTSTRPDVARGDLAARLLEGEPSDDDVAPP